MDDVLLHIAPHIVWVLMLLLLLNIESNGRIVNLSVDSLSITSLFSIKAWVWSLCYSKYTKSIHLLNADLDEREQVQLLVGRVMNYA